MSTEVAGKVLVVDDQPANVELLADLLGHHGYDVATAANGDAALGIVKTYAPDLILLDIVMPGLSGLDVCRRLRADPCHSMLPIVLVTSLDPETERINGLDAGADDFLAKPINAPELLARVRSLLRVKRLFDQTQAQAVQLHRLNTELEQLVAVKVDEVARLSRLRRFVAPQLAERIVAGDASDPLVSHRRDIVVVFFDLRGFTAFAEASAPEDVMGVLRDFHQTVGVKAREFAGTIERFAGDGVMVFFNDPEPVPDPCLQAVRFAIATIATSASTLVQWRRNGFTLDIGAGLAYGFATLGAVGFADRLDYSAIGTVTNLAARLCAEAKGGEILLSGRAAAMLPASMHAFPLGPMNLKGFRDSVEKNDPELRDAAAGVLCTKTINDLEKPGIRNLVRTELMAVFNSVMGKGVITDIYFTEFAIQ